MDPIRAPVCESIPKVGQTRLYTRNGFAFGARDGSAASARSGVQEAVQVSPDELVLDQKAVVAERVN